MTNDDVVINKMTRRKPPEKLQPPKKMQTEFFFKQLNASPVRLDMQALQQSRGDFNLSRGFRPGGLKRNGANLSRRKKEVPCSPYIKHIISIELNDKHQFRRVQKKKKKVSFPSKTRVSVSELQLVNDANQYRQQSGFGQSTVNAERQDKNRLEIKNQQRKKKIRPSSVHVRNISGSKQNLLNQQNNTKIAWGEIPDWIKQRETINRKQPKFILHGQHIKKDVTPRIRNSLRTKFGTNKSSSTKIFTANAKYKNNDSNIGGMRYYSPNISNMPKPVFVITEAKEKKSKKKVFCNLNTDFKKSRRICNTKNKHKVALSPAMREYKFSLPLKQTISQHQNVKIVNNNKLGKTNYGSVRLSTQVIQFNRNFSRPKTIVDLKTKEIQSQKRPYSANYTRQNSFIMIDKSMS